MTHHLVSTYPESHKGKPLPIARAIKNLIALFENPFRYAAGRMAWNHEKPNQQGIFRLVRAEVRGGGFFGCVAQNILYYVDLKSLRVGMMNDGKFKNIGIKALWKLVLKNGIMISLKRVKRVIHRMAKLGYLTITENKRRLLNGKFVSDPATLTVSEQFFLDLDIDKETMYKYRNKEEIAERNRELAEKDRLRKETAKLEKKQFKANREFHQAPQQPRPQLADFTGCAEARKDERSNPDTAREALSKIRAKLRSPPS